MEYYYIDFVGKDICSWVDEGTDIDKANKLIGNSFESFNDAENRLMEILKYAGSPSIKSKIIE